jgi:hypothetical protein
LVAMLIAQRQSIFSFIIEITISLYESNNLNILLPL